MSVSMLCLLILLSVWAVEIKSARDGFSVTMTGFFAQNSSTLYSLPFSGPAVDAAMDNAHTAFPNLTVRYDKIKRADIQTCQSMIENTDVISD